MPKGYPKSLDMNKRVVTMCIIKVTLSSNCLVYYFSMMTTNIYPSSPSNVMILQHFCFTQKTKTTKKTSDLTAEKVTDRIQGASICQVHSLKWRQTDQHCWLAMKASFISHLNTCLPFTLPFHQEFFRWSWWQVWACFPAFQKSFLKSHSVFNKDKMNLKSDA